MSNLGTIVRINSELKTAAEGRATGLSREERELGLSLIYDAVLSYQRPKADRRQKEAQIWLFYEDDNNSPLSFVSLCDSFGFDVGWMRRMIKEVTLNPPAPLSRVRRIVNPSQHVGSNASKPARMA